MKITFLGHATLWIEIETVKILVDPFISANELAREIDVKTLKPDYILITHAHQDHILDVETIAAQSNAILVSNYEIISYYDKKGIKGHPMNHGGSWTFDFGKLTYTQAVHSSTFPDGTYGGQPGGFTIKTKEHYIYIAGDTALTYDMKLIPLKGNLDLAILPIGDNFTMGVDDALNAAKFLECDKVLGVHYDTFGYIKIDKNKAVETFASKEKDLILLPVGKSISLDK